MAEGRGAVMGGWAELPNELMWMVLEKLQAPGRVSPLAGEWGGFEGSKHLRLLSRGWRASHDALVTRLTVSWKTTDEGMWLLVRRFPAVVSVERKYDGSASHLTDKGLRAVSSLTGLTSLSLSYCRNVTDEGMMLAVSRLTKLKSLNLTWCSTIREKGLRAVCTLSGLTSLNLSYSVMVTDTGLQAVSNLTGLTSLELRRCNKVTDEGLQAVSRLTGLKSLDLRQCFMVTSAGVDALRRDTASSNLHIHSQY
jgi:hypothetical protein